MSYYQLNLVGDYDPYNARSQSREPSGCWWLGANLAPKHLQPSWRCTYQECIFGCRLVDGLDLRYKFHNAPVPYPTMYHFVTEMCTCVHISVTKWCIVGYLSNVLLYLWDGSISFPAVLHWGEVMYAFYWLISSELVQKERVFFCLIIHHLIMITCISYGNIFAILVPKCINIAPL